MKRIAALAILLALSAFVVAAKAQSPELVQNVWKKLGADEHIEQIPVRLQLHVSDKPEVNAWTTPRTGNIYVSKQMLALIGPSEGELAFVLGHEIGHVLGYWTGLSTQAQQQQMKADLSSFLSVLGLVFESQQDRENRYSHVEEKLADSIGLFVIKESGYNPYDAAAFFGRLQMYAGTTDPATRMWNPYTSSHPFNEDRIENLRQVMSRLQETKNSEEAQETAYIWMGIFSLTIQGTDGQRQTVETRDGLGVYTEDDFRAAEAIEVEARKDLIRKFVLHKYAGQIAQVVSVELKEIERQVFQEQEQREQWPKKKN